MAEAWKNKWLEQPTQLSCTLRCSVSWWSQLPPVCRMPQERRIPREARVLMHEHSQQFALMATMLERQSTDTEAGVLSGISQKHNMRSGFCRFTEFCNSQCLSHFAAPFIVVRAETSIAESCELVIAHGMVNKRASETLLVKASDSRNEQGTCR